MTEIIYLVAVNLWHTFETLMLFAVVGALTAPVVFGWYHYDRCKEERSER